MSTGEVCVAAGLAYRRLGRGEPIVLVHGLGGSHRSWDAVVPSLQSHRDVIALDLPGFGDSPPLPAASPHTPAMLAAAVERLLDALGLDRPHVAGHSLGGWVALELAASGRANSVTAFCPAGLWASTAPRDVRVRLRTSRVLALTCRRLAPLLLASRFGRRALLSGSCVRAADVPATLAIAAAADLAGATGYPPVYSGTVDGRFAASLAWNVPVHVVLADSDQLLPPADNRCSAELPPDTTWGLLPQCGHNALWDDPPAVAAAILDNHSQAPT